jgi:hypothetical protein
MTKDKAPTEYAVHAKISGRATVFTEAQSEAQAVDRVNSGEFYGGELIEWDVEEAVSAEENV